jgi:hypothetical protein
MPRLVGLVAGRGFNDLTVELVERLRHVHLHGEQ